MVPSPVSTVQQPAVPSPIPEDNCEDDDYEPHPNEHTLDFDFDSCPDSPQNSNDTPLEAGMFLCVRRYT